jgi:hypothetical protein
MATRPNTSLSMTSNGYTGTQAAGSTGFGTAVQESAPTWAHAILQQLIAELIRQARMHAAK